MALNAYSVCPLGSGKKIKFCCPREHLADYLKVFELMEAEQFAAAEALSDRLVAKAPDQVCFLGLKATFSDPADETSCREITDRLIKAAPEHPITFASQVNVALHDMDLKKAIQHIQDSIERLENAVPQLLLSGIANVAGLAYEEGHLQSAIGLNNYVLTLSKFRHSDSLDFYYQISSNRSLPPPYKDQFLIRLREAFPEKADRRISQLADRGWWRMARDELKTLVENPSENPWAIGTLAVIHGILAEDEDSYACWRRLSEIPGLPLFLAADAVIMAEHLKETLISPEESTVPRLLWTYEVRDLDKLMEHFLSDRRMLVRPTPADYPRDGDEPPPKAFATFLEHELPRDPKGLTFRDYPRTVAASQVFGRQTDRGARIEVIATLFPGVPVRETVDDRLRDFVVGPPEETELIGVSRLDLGSKEFRQIPRDMPPKEKNRIAKEALDHTIQHVWFETPHPYLHEKTPEEAAADPTYQARLAAALVVLESLPVFGEWDQSYDPLWSRLGLPGPLRPTNLDEVVNMGLSAMLHMDPETLPDEDLTYAFGWADRANLIQAVRRIGDTILQRPSLRGSRDLNPIFQELEQSVWTAEEKLKYCELAQEWCRSTSHPFGEWILRGITSKLLLEDLPGIQKDLDELVKNHLGEPGIAENLQQLLMMMGVIGPDGRPTQMVGPGRSAPGATGGSAPPGLWTPDQATGDTSTPSKLWIPGSD